MLWLHSSTGRNLAVAATRLNMAQAERVVTYEEKVSVKLTLTIEEARALQLFLGRAYGDPKTTFRSTTDRIWEALAGTGVGSHDSCGVIAYESPALTPAAIKYIEGK